MTDIVIVDASTGEQVRRPLTAEEQAQRDADAQAAAERQATEDAETGTRITIEDRLDQALDAMRAHVQRGTFTAAQRDAALLLVLRVSIGVVRLLRRKLDGSD